VPTKHLKPGEALLFEQRIKGCEQLAPEDLEGLYRQRPNRKLLYLPLMPYLSAYYWGKPRHERTLERDTARMRQREQAQLAEALLIRRRLDSLQQQGAARHDTLALSKRLQRRVDKAAGIRENLERRVKDGNWFMRSVGEPPSIYRPDLQAETAEQMSRYLRSKGFFSGRAQATADSARRRVSVTYWIKEGMPHLIDSLHYRISDTALHALVAGAAKQSLLREGERFNEQRFEAERLRLLRLMKDNGYYDAVKSYILFEVDTTRAPYRAGVTTVVLNPPGSEAHRRYRVSSVIFNTEAGVSRRRSDSDTTFDRRGVAYMQGRKHYSTRVLSRKVFIQPGAFYSQSDAEETQRALASLNIFRFVNIKYDTTGGKFQANIFTSPYPKYQITAEGGLNVGQAFIPGPFMSFSFTNRNMLNSADIFEVRAQFSVEGQASVTDPNSRLRSLQGNVYASLTLPRIAFPIPLAWKRLLGPRMPKTQLSIGYSYIDRPEYARTNLQSVLGYQWNNRRQANFNFSLIDLGIVNTASIDTAFLRRLQELQAQGNTLINSFDRSIVSSTSMAYTKLSGQYGQRGRAAGYFRASVESGGSILSAIKQGLPGNDDSFLGLRYYNFFKVSADKRWSVPMGSEGRQLAARLHAGLANAYGRNQALPYEKYFFSGGSSSNRAWRARRVGPGSYAPDGTSSSDSEQYGEILLEANLELRGNLFGFVDGALFVDATNVWMVEEDPNRPGAKFEWQDFWKEMAIGAGVGVRFDFSFLLIRFDLGIKMYDPARPVGERFVGNALGLKSPLGEPGQYLLNLGIGYPF
jgi:outer membrane protein assembly factor BamA